MLWNITGTITGDVPSEDTDALETFQRGMGEKCEEIGCSVSPPSLVSRHPFHSLIHLNAPLSLAFRASLFSPILLLGFCSVFPSPSGMQCKGGKEGYTPTPMSDMSAPQLTAVGYTFC